MSQPIFIQSPGFGGATVNIEQRFNGLRGFGFGAEKDRGGVNFDTLQHDASRNAGTPATGADTGDIKDRTTSALREFYKENPGVNPRVVGAISLAVGAAILGVSYKALYKNNHPVAGVVVGLLFGVGPAVSGAMLLASGDKLYA